MVYNTTPLLRVLILRTCFIIGCMGPLGHPYPDFHPLVPPSIFYLLQASVNLPRPLLYSILLFFLLCISFILLPSSSGMDSCCIWRTDFSSTISNFPPFASNIPFYTSCFPTHTTFWLYIFLVTLC